MDVIDIYVRYCNRYCADIWIEELSYNNNNKKECLNLHILFDEHSLSSVFLVIPMYDQCVRIHFSHS